jgi:hypothetical protein
MMLTELYYYSGNYPAAKAASRGAFRFSPTVRCDEANAPLAALQRPPGSTRTDVLRQRTVHEVPINCTTVGISASYLRRNRETASEFERSLDRQSRNKLTAKPLKKAGRPASAKRKAAPNPTTELPMAELTEHTVFVSSAHPFCARPELAADQLIDTLEVALRRVTGVSADASLPLADLAHRALAALARIRIAGRLASISDQVAREFRLCPDDLQSRTRDQREHFNRDHSTVIHAYQLIERRMRDAAFRLFIEKLEAQITGTVPTTRAAAA